MAPSQQGSEAEKAKWKGKATTEVKGAKAEQVWLLLEDFFGLDKWFPTLSTCIPVEGISGQPGCVRFCAGFKTPLDGHAKQTVNWTKQKLLSIDPAHRTFSYSIVDGNVGFHSYVSTLKVHPKAEGCEIEWLYEVEPVEGWKLEYLDSFIDTGLQVMAQRMQAALKTMEQALMA
ncbi:Lachrymatory-factor synthase [Spatholobus suberectus]|nr:Lachrymatory-factor synthase [Spatholobus suberectus]